MSATPTEPPAQQATPLTTDAGAAAAAATTPFSNGSAEAAEILRQADLLKQRNAAVEQENAALAAEVKAYRAHKEEQDKRFAEEREPQYNEYVKHLEAKKGGPLDEKQKSVLRAAFCKPEYKQDGDRMWGEYQDAMAVMASKKSLEQELAAMRAERDKLLETQSKLTQSLGPSATRASYASAVAVPDMAAVTAGAAASGVTKEVGGGGLALNEIMGAAPSATEVQMGFLQEYCFPTEFGVRASSAGGKQLRSSVPAAPEHGLLYDKYGDKTHPASMRWNAPHLFAFYANNRSYLDGDTYHNQVVVRNAQGNFEQPINSVNDIK